MNVKPPCGDLHWWRFWWLKKWFNSSASWERIKIFKSNFPISSWRQCPSTQKKNHHPNLPHQVLLPCGHTQEVLKWGHVFHLWSLFFICAFLPLLGSCEGKTQKRQVAGENKKTNGANSPPHSQITSTHLHTPTTPPLYLPLSHHDGMVMRDDPNVPLF